MSMHGLCFLLLWTVCQVRVTNSYFGLTEKTQLSDLWNIDLDAASLATASHFEAWEIDPSKPQPSLDYKPIKMNTGSSKPLPVKRKRASRSRHHFKSQRQTDFDLSSNESSLSNRNQRFYSRNENAMQNQKNSIYQKQNRWNHNSGYFSKQQTGQHSQKIFNTRHSYSHKPFSTRLNSSQNLTNFAHRGIKSNVFTNLDKQDVEYEDLSKDLKLLMEKSPSFKMNSHLIPRVRNERESGKRRDIGGVSRHPQQFLISSSVSESLSSSPVRRHSVVEQEKKPPEQIAKIQNVSSSRKNGKSFFFNENMLNTHTTFSESKEENQTNLIEPQKINKKEARKLCDSFKLTTYQKRKCKKDPGLPQVLAKATHIAAAECMYQFRYERWNCSLGTSRIHLLNRGNKETAFLYSISSAGLTHSVARACAEGHLESCSCEETFEDHVNQEAWLWGGCGDNVHFAAKFVKKFLKSRGDHMDVRAEIDRHNSDLGIRFVKSNVQQTCKCHGVSGSCTTKSCWRKMASFYHVGRKIKHAYDRAVKVENTSNSSGKPKLVRSKTRRRRQKPNKNRRRKGPKKRNEPKSKYPRNNHRIRSTTESAAKSRNENIREAPRKKELVYLEKSPPYCRKTKYSLGTKGRICGKKSNCKRMCCGRGYTTHVRIIRRSCNCQVKWCCYVKCKTCNERKQIRTCK